MAELKSVTDPAGRAREYVLEAHAETVETVLQCADAVASEWDGPTATDQSEVADPLRAELEAEGTWTRLPDVLAGAVRAAGYSLSAPPVADPPYVVATSRGPMLRATISDGRLVVLLECFAVERSDGGRNRVRYARISESAESAVRVSFE